MCNHQKHFLTKTYIVFIMSEALEPVGTQTLAWTERLIITTSHAERMWLKAAVFRKKESVGAYSMPASSRRHCSVDEAEVYVCGNPSDVDALIAELAREKESFASVDDLPHTSPERTVMIPTTFYKSVVGAYMLQTRTDGSQAHYFPKLVGIGKPHHVLIRAPQHVRESFNCASLFIEHGTAEQVSAAKSALYQELGMAMGIPGSILLSIAGTLPYENSVYVYVDYSNIAIQAQIVVPGSSLFPPKTPAGTRDLSIALNIPALCNVLEAGRPRIYGEAVGSMNEPNALEWRGSGYDATRTLMDKSGNADEILHAHMLQTILEASLINKRYVLVLATGDGNINKGRTKSTFPRVVAQALAMGWFVEVACWSNSASKVYTAFQGMFPSRFKLRHLDEVHAKVCKR